MYFIAPKTDYQAERGDIFHFSNMTIEGRKTKIF